VNKSALVIIFTLIGLATVGARQTLQPTTNSIGQKFVWIQPGTFTIGSPITEYGRDHNRFLGAEPQSQVEIKNGFWMNRYETTQADYERIMGQNPSAYCANGRLRGKVVGLNTQQHPVEAVTCLDAAEFCRRLSALPEEKKHGRTYRLPTDEEWEYACRAGTTTAFHFGKSLDGSQANCCGRIPYHSDQTESKRDPNGIWLERSTAVGQYQPNLWGLYDMHGNVAEWTSTPYRLEEKTEGRRYYSDSNGDYRVSRGGSNGNPAQSCRSASRHFLPKDGGAFGAIGFRVVMEITPEKK
jgi:formylglycine-generating enzyme required for sulfatase activity